MDGDVRTSKKKTKQHQMQLKKVVDHPYLVVYSKTSNAHSSDPKSTTNPFTTVDKCAICHDLSDDPVTASCGHMFCRECIAGYTTSSGPASCTSYAKPLTIDFIGRSEAQNQKAIKISKRYSSFKPYKLERFSNKHKD